MGRIAARVVEAIAECHGAGSSEPTIPLYDAVDPDALETLLESNAVTVTFEYCGCEVTAHGSELRVEPAGDPPRH